MTQLAKVASIIGYETVLFCVVFPITLLSGGILVAYRGRLGQRRRRGHQRFDRSERESERHTLGKQKCGTGV